MHSMSRPLCMCIYTVSRTHDTRMHTSTHDHAYMPNCENPPPLLSARPLSILQLVASSMLSRTPCAAAASLPRAQLLITALYTCLGVGSAFRVLLRVVFWCYQVSIFRVDIPTCPCSPSFAVADLQSRFHTKVAEGLIRMKSEQIAGKL